jgi:succinate-semialdehyde dehydrogenase/glutarate-semialdehyde dehydrogenase
MAVDLTTHEPAVLSTVPTRLFIGGRWTDGAGTARFDVEDPASGETLVSVPNGTAADALDALVAAEQAGPAFRAWAPRERSDVLRRAYELIIERADDLALLMTLEMGKPLAESRTEVLYAASFLRWYSEEAVRIAGRYASSELGGGRLLTMKQPVGPCLFITPWNFPLAMGTRKIGPAVAAGCTMVVKPAAQTPLSMLALAQIFQEAGLPDGVLNVVTVDAPDAAAAMAPLIADPRLRKLSFTGSTAVGRQLIAQSAEQVLKVSMELGGNAPFLVFDDADVDAAIDGAMLAKMRNGGQACTSANRFYVHESLVDTFAQGFTARMQALNVGRGTEPAVELGPMIDATQRDKVASLVDDAVARGATVLCGGAPVDGPGYFFAPTVLRDVPADAELLSQEIFGPVAPIVTFGDEAEAIAAANATEYGLVGYVYARDVGRAFAVAEALDTGMVGLNQGVVANAGAPFGGVKQSGFGREGGPEGIEEYLETKYLALSLDRI